MNQLPRNAVLVGALLLAVVAGTTADVSLPQQAPSDTPSKPPAANVSVVPATLAHARLESGRVELPLIAVNHGTETARIWFRPLLFDTSGNPVAATAHGLWRDKTNDGIAPGEVVPFTLAVEAASGPFRPWWERRLPLKGHIAIHTTSDKGPTIASQKIEVREINVPQAQPSAVEIIAVAAPAVFALLMVGLGTGAATGHVPDGLGSWSADSIGTNTALGAGLVSGIIGLAALPQLTVLANRTTYAVVIAIFTAVVALGTPAANILGRIARPRSAFFVAATLVLWGALGQFIVVAFLVGELVFAGVIARTTAALLLVLDVVLAFGVTFYIVDLAAHPEKAKVHVPTAQPDGTVRMAAAVEGTWTIP